MVWWFVALLAWVVLAVPAAMLFGSATRTAERREDSRRPSVVIPRQRALTPSR